MDVQRTPEPPDRYEQLREIGLLGKQFGELVDDDEQRWHRLETHTRRARTLVLGDVGEVSRGTKHLLATSHLTGERVLHPIDHRQLLFEVGDDRRDVWRPFEPQERRPAFEVDEHQVEFGGRMGRQHRHDKRAQKLGLPRTRCADAQSVRPGSAVCALFDVEFDGGSIRLETDRNTQTILTRPSAPFDSWIESGNIVDAEESGQSRVSRRGFGVQVGQARRGCHMIASQSACNGLRFGDRQPIHVGELLDADSASRTNLSAANRQLESASRREAVGRGGQIENGHLFGTGIVDQPLVTGDVAVVDDHDEVRSTGDGRRGSAESTAVE
ncbi:Uncharacterised protein [Mycobacteroides abscessus subsp. abscessus]|nr:Uncharacterised protein [Mycobacteroides abscessus subsp. abscessus]